MSQSRNQFYFVFCPRDGESTNMKGNSIITIQDYHCGKIYIDQDIKDPETGKTVTQTNNIPGANYTTEILYINKDTNEAIVSITRKTKTGSETKEFKIDPSTCATYIDNNFIMKFGISKFEEENTKDPNEIKEITKRNIELIRRLANLNKVNLLSSEDNQNYEPEK